MSRRIITYLAGHVPSNRKLFGGTVPPLSTNSQNQQPLLFGHPVLSLVILQLLANFILHLKLEIHFPGGELQKEFFLGHLFNQTLNFFLMAHIDGMILTLLTSSVKFQLAASVLAG